MLSAALRKELVSAQNDPKYTLWDLVPFEDQVLTNQLGGDISKYDSLERDCHLYAVLSKLQLGVVAHEWEVIPASKALRDIKAADRVRDQLMTAVVPESNRLDKLKMSSGDAKGNDFDAISLHLLDALLKGCSFAEPMWVSDGGEIRLGELRGKPQHRFRFAIPNAKVNIYNPYLISDSNKLNVNIKGAAYHEGYLIKLLTTDNQYDGELLPEKKIICHSFGSKTGNPYGLGFGSKLWFPIQFKKEILKFWLYGADKFSNPTPYGKHPPGITDLSPLTNALNEFSQGGWFTLPEEFEIALLESARAGNSEFFEKFLHYLDLEISKCIAGETLTTQLGAQGSLAATQVHADIRLERIKAIADGLSTTLNRTICKWITELNDPTANPPTIWRIIDAGQDLNARAARDKELSEATGRLLDIGYVERVYGVKFSSEQLTKVTETIKTQIDDPSDLSNTSTDSNNQTNLFREWDAEARDKLSSGEIKGAFAGPDQSYPIADSKDAENAWNLAGHAGNPDGVRRRIISICKNYALTIPKAAQDWLEHSETHNYDESVGKNLEMNLRKSKYKDFINALKPEIKYCQWVHTSKGDVRPNHVDLNGLVFDVSDPLLVDIFPPTAINCRCEIKALTETEFKSSGKSVTGLTGKLLKDVAEYLDYPDSNKWGIK